VADAMSFYNTGNPVPSIDPRDLDDNAKHIDEIVNSTDLTFVDRLGTERLTMAGLEAEAAASVTLRLDLAEPDGADLSGFYEGTVKSVLDGTTPFGPATQRVDQETDVVQSGPFIKRPWATTQRMSIFVDPVAGNDTNAGSQVAPLRTIDAALALVPQNIYHRVYVYLLDGDYTTQKIKAFNYYVTARSSAGFKIIGHVASVDGVAHPLYTSDNPSAVVLRNEHVISGIIGTEEFTIAGVTFTNSWVEAYDAYVVLDRCNFQNGFDSGTYYPRICLSGHYAHIKAVTCNFDACAMVIDAEGHMIALFENCAVTNMIVSPWPGIGGGFPTNARNGAEVYVKNSPTFNATHVGGRSKSDNGSIIYDQRYSDVGSVNYIWRGNAAADESVQIQGGNGKKLGDERGAGIGVYGRNHATLPGYQIQEFGTSTAARWIMRFKGVGVSRDIVTAFPLGDVKFLNSVVFSINADTAPNLLTNGSAMLYVLANGDVYVQSMVAGVRKATKILDFATATVQP
jgi:hypothetical protein